MLTIELAELKSQLPDKGCFIQNIKTMTGRINHLVSDVAQLLVKYEHIKVITGPATSTLGAAEIHFQKHKCPPPGLILSALE